MQLHAIHNPLSNSSRGLQKQLLSLSYGKSCIEHTDVEFLHEYSALCMLLIGSQLLYISLS